MLHLAVIFAAALLSILTIGCTDDESTGPEPNGSLPAIELELVMEGLSDPLFVTAAPGDTARLFVVEQPGRIKIIKPGTLLTTPFLDISTAVAYGGEQGLLSIAFPPDFDQVGHFYICYTRAEDGATVVARYGVDEQDPDLADEATEEEVLLVAQPYSNHNGGMMAFGPDGYLYISLGDGGGSGDPDGNGQDPNTLLGSILRIDVESGGAPYSIPGDNPFVGQPNVEEEIWTWGLRNPWRFSFDRDTGDLYIADVGQNLWEEIDYSPASSQGGENYGWNIMEGTHCYNATSCDETGLTLPLYEYDHESGCSVTGGYVYRGSMNTGLEGVYLFGDYCSGIIWGLTNTGGQWSARVLLDTQLRIVSFGEDARGEIYVVDIAGAIYRISQSIVSDEVPE